MKKRKLVKRDKLIFITVDSRGNFVYTDAYGNDARRFTLRVGESIKWVYADGPFTVDFMPLSPFAYSKFHGNAGATSENATARTDRPPGRYEYSVAGLRIARGKATILTDDPDLIIIPRK